MRYLRTLSAAMAGAVAFTSLTAAPILAQDKGGGDEPVTLRLGTLEASGSGWHDVLDGLAGAVERGTNGAVSIDVVADLALLDPEHPEQEVVRQLSEGEIDLALVPARGWNEAGVTSLRALQAPFLITNDALAAAVATSDIAENMLEEMASAGFTGLVMWPDDLRHPIAYEVCAGGPFLQPTDLAGERIRSVPAEDNYALLKALGATPVFQVYGDGSCGLSGHETGLKVDLTPPAATATGNVTFFPRLFVLAGNSQSLESLDDRQMEALRGAALNARADAMDQHLTEAELGTAWCEDLGQRIVHASQEDVAAWMEAGASVTASLREDATTSRFIDEISELAASVEPSPVAAACEPSGGQAEVPSEPGEVEAGTWSTSMWPAGTYRMELTGEQVRSGEVPDLFSMVGVNTLTITNGTFRIDIGTADGDTGDCYGTVIERDGVLHTEWASTAICGGWADFRWLLDDDGLHLQLVDSNYPEVDRVWFESNPWTKIE